MKRREWLLGLRDKTSLFSLPVKRDLSISLPAPWAVMIPLSFRLSLSAAMVRIDDMDSSPDKAMVNFCLSIYTFRPGLYPFLQINIAVAALFLFGDASQYRVHQGRRRS
jgi:hypothetical protein